MAEVKTLKSADLAKESLQAEGTILVDFWASWCGPCRMMSPVIDKIAEEYDGKVTVGKLNIDDETDAAVAMGVSSIPTLVLFQDGVEKDRIIGAVPQQTLKAFIDKNL
jgi:thioredoxin 1